MSKKTHSEYIGDKIERAIEVIEEENDEYYYGELLNQYADNELDVEVNHHGNYLQVTVHD